MENHNQILNPQAQLNNIRNMIRLTTDNLSKLNERFAGFRHPPQIYLNEYEQLTTKLNEFQNQEQKLMEQLSNEENSDEEQDANQYDSHNSDIQYSPLDHQSNEFNFDTFSRARVNDFSNLNDLTNSNLNSSNNTPPTPKSPFKSIVRAHLPNFQRTTVQVKKGETVKESLFKAMKRRKLDYEMCEVSIVSPYRRVINWDDDISLFEGMEIEVVTRERFPISTSISHNFVCIYY